MRFPFSTPPFFSSPHIWTLCAISACNRLTICTFFSGFSPVISLFPWLGRVVWAQVRKKFHLPPLLAVAFRFCWSFFKFLPNPPRLGHNLVPQGLSASQADGCSCPPIVALNRAVFLPPEPFLRFAAVLPACGPFPPLHRRPLVSEVVLTLRCTPSRGFVFLVLPSSPPKETGTPPSAPQAGVAAGFFVFAGFFAVRACLPFFFSEV